MRDDEGCRDPMNVTVWRAICESEIHGDCPPG